MSMASKIVTFIFTLFSTLSASIIQIDDLSRFEQELETLDTGCLVVLDVDDTLIYPKDSVLRSPTSQRFNQLVLERLQALQSAPEGHNIPFLTSKVMLKMDFWHVDPKSVEIVQEIQAKKIPVVALTAAYPGRVGVVERAADWRVGHLKKLGFDFSSSYPNVGPFEFVGIPGTAFQDGVLFSWRYPKGDILLAFLKAINFKPKKILFLDDRIDFIRSVESAANHAGIENLCFHYRAVDKIPHHVDWNIASLQAEHLALHGEWLHDHEVVLNDRTIER